jgi:hypothetical protein
MVTRLDVDAEHFGQDRGRDLGQALIAWRQRAGDDERGADVREGAAGRHRVQRLVGDGGLRERDGVQGVADAGLVQLLLVTR